MYLTLLLSRKFRDEIMLLCYCTSSLLWKYRAEAALIVQSCLATGFTAKTEVQK